jgi:hypothetical protein
MTPSPQPKLRTVGSIFVLCFILLLLTLEFFNGGISSHHLLNQADLPAISNSWGLLLPLLAWWLLGSLQQRLAQSTNTHAGRNAIIAGSIIFCCSLALATSFQLQHMAITEWIFQGLLLSAIVLPFYRAELFLAVALGMTFAFGAILPTGVATVLALISLLCQRVLWPLLQKIWLWLQPKSVSE